MELQTALSTLFPWVEPVCDNDVSISSCTDASDFFFSFSDLVGDDSEEGIHGAMVEGVSGWRSLRAGEQAAGLSNGGEILIKFTRCDICGICIGPGYYEQSLYLFPVYGGYLQYLSKPNCVLKFDEFSVLKCCGGCAKHRSRMLPDWLCVLSSASWETTILLCREDEIPNPLDRYDSQMMERVYAAAEEIIHAYYRYFFLIFLLSLNISLSWVYAAWHEQQQRDLQLQARSKQFITSLLIDMPMLPMQPGILPPLRYVQQPLSA